MPKIHRSETFKDDVVQLDGRQFEDCTFNECQMHFSGHAPLNLKNCRFNNCKWVFKDAAQLTLNILTEMYHGGMKPVVEETLKNIRSGVYLKPPYSKSVH